MNKKQSFGKILMESLTKEQMVLLLDIILSEQDLSGFIDEFKNADPDLALTVEKIINPGLGEPGKLPVSATASDKRIMELWADLWREWEDIVQEVGDEEGEYMVQDEHWEPPYFDGYALASDLDRVAESMLEMIDDVFELVDHNDLFQDSLEEIGLNIDSYPEWLGVCDHEGCDLGRESTLCLLKWVWLALQNQEQPGIDFLRRIFQLDEAHQMVCLDPGTVFDFFSSLPDEIRRDVYSGLGEDPESYGIDNIGSKWHRIHHYMEEQYDIAGYLETCREHLSENWHYGKPLINDAIGNDDYPRADNILERTFASYLRKKGEKPWHPETALLSHRPGWYSQHSGEIAELLDTWEKVSEKLDNPLRKTACKFQAIIVRTPNDWEAVIGCYNSMGNAGLRQSLQPLLDTWKKTMVKDSTYHYDYSSRKPSPSETWVDWLIEALTDIDGRREWFIGKLLTWLEALDNQPKEFEDQWNWLAVFTMDAPGKEKWKKQYPALFRAAFPLSNVKSDLALSRKKALKTISAGESFEQAIEVWKKQFFRLVPDPSKSSKSQYQIHASWMKALFELNRKDYDTLLDDWRKRHGRRKNLWRDMRGEGLPV